MQWRSILPVLPVAFALACGSSVSVAPEGDAAASDAGELHLGGDDGKDDKHAGDAGADTGDTGADAGRDADAPDAGLGCSEEARLPCVPDEDNDRYASSAVAVRLCPDPSRAQFGDCPDGYVAPGSSLGIDCAAADGASFQKIPARLDSDGDGYCAGATFDACAGLTLPAGLREAGACQPTDDCDDATAAAYRIVSLRPDGDGDGYCASAVSTQCIGATVPAGMRLASTCNATTDCKDSNPYATTTCSYVVSSTTFQKSCGIGVPATQSGTVSISCGSGFRPDGVAAVNNSDNGVTSCSAPFAIGNATQTLTQTCNFGAIGSSNCHISVLCVAN